MKDILQLVNEELHRLKEELKNKEEINDKLYSRIMFLTREKQMLRNDLYELSNKKFKDDKKN